MKKLLVLTAVVLAAKFVAAQEQQVEVDTIVAAQTQQPTTAAQPAAPDTSRGINWQMPATRRDTIVVAPSAFLQNPNYKFQTHPFFTFTNPVQNFLSIKQWQGKDALFYTLVAMLIFFALIKNSFFRYVQDLFKVFFRTSVRQRQIKEQLLQSPLPSILFNLFFLLSTGLFLALLLQHYKIVVAYGFWWLFAACVLALLLVYLGKYLVLKMMGWILQAPKTTDAYIFVVFTTNKVIGIILLPFLLVVGLSVGAISMAGINLGVAVILLLFAYRYFLSYVSLKGHLQLSIFHFLIYLLALEIAPLLLINKLLLNVLS